MEKVETEEIEEKISEEETPLIPNPNPEITSGARSVKTKVPEVEINLFRSGKGPIEVFKSSLGGWDQDRLEVVDILEKYEFKSIFAFHPGSGRGAPIRFNAKNGRSLIPYTDGSVIFIDGEPKDSLIKPITKILFGLCVSSLLISFVVRGSPKWLIQYDVFGGNFPPWILACVVIVFTRLRKRTRNFLEKYGW